jgi:hypothetical protein
VSLRFTRRPISVPAAEIARAENAIVPPLRALENACPKAIDSSEQRQRQTGSARTKNNDVKS